MSIQEEYYFDKDAEIVLAKDTRIIEREETRYMGLDGVPVTLTTTVRVDRNGDKVSDMELNNQESRKFIDEYRRITGKLTQAEIREIREKLGLSQRGFAHLVGWSSTTVERYERSNAPNPANNQILKSLRDMTVVKEYFKQADKTKFSKKDLATLEQLVGENQATSFIFKSAKEIADWFIIKNFKEISIDPANNEQFSQMKLHKLVYFAQVYFAGLKKNKFLFSEDALAFQHGPVFESIRKGYEFDADGNGFKFTDDMLQELLVTESLVEKDEDVRKVLNDIWRDYSIYTAGHLRNLTHKPSSSWKKHYNGTAFKIIPKDDIIKDYDIYQSQK